MITQQMPLRCSNCGQQYVGEIETIVDVSKDPQAKARLLTDSLNTAQCPNCGTVNKVIAPLLYHDPGKELLIAMVPMAVQADNATQERIVGDLMNQLPKDNFKGYMFNPRRALTMQGLIEQVLQADGISPEEWRARQQEQREQIELIQQLLNAESEEQLENLINEHDDEIDQSFFMTMSAMTQNLMANGRTEIAQQIIYLQNALTGLTSYGRSLIERQQQVVNELTEALEKLPPEGTRSDIFDLAMQHADRPDYLQTLVRLVRPAMDYQFFQELSTKIGQLPASEREKAEDLRNRLLEITSMIDQQAQAGAVAILQAAINHPEPEAFLRANIGAVDENFLAILQANIENAKKHGNVEASARLTSIQDIVGKIMQEMESTTTFLRQLLASEDPEALLCENPDLIDDNLLTLLIMNIQLAEQNGDDESATFMRRVYEIVVDQAHEDMQPELLFMNELLAAEDDETAVQLMHEHAGEFDEELLDIINAIEEMLQTQGGDAASTQRMARLREAARASLNT